MKTTTFKRMLAALLVAVMALCVLTGCNKEPEQTEPQNIGTPLPVGMFVLTAGASVNVSYDVDGLVVKIDGNNENGINLSDAYTDYLGKPCADAAKELILAASKGAYLTANTRNIVIKQVIGATLPGSHFLETIENAVKDAAAEVKSNAVITLIDSEKMDENGYINLETAQVLLCNELGVEKLDAYYGQSTPTDDHYICTAEVGGKQTHHSVDAVTGIIATPTNAELMGESTDEEEILPDYDEEYEDEIIDAPVEEELPEETAPVTTPEEDGSEE